MDTTQYRFRQKMPQTNQKMLLQPNYPELIEVAPVKSKLNNINCQVVTKEATKAEVANSALPKINSVTKNHCPTSPCLILRETQLISTWKACIMLRLTEIEYRPNSMCWPFLMVLNSMACPQCPKKKLKKDSTQMCRCYHSRR